MLNPVLLCPVVARYAPSAADSSVGNPASMPLAVSALSTAAAGVPGSNTVALNIQRWIKSLSSITLE